MSYAIDHETRQPTKSNKKQTLMTTKTQCLQSKLNKLTCTSLKKILDLSLSRLGIK